MAQRLWHRWRHERKFQRAPDPVLGSPATAGKPIQKSAPWLTKVLDSRKFKAPLWGAGMAPAAAPVVAPYLEPAETLRRRGTRYRLVASPPILHVAPAVAATPLYPSWKGVKPNLVRFDRALRIVEEIAHFVQPQAPPSDLVVAPVVHRTSFERQLLGPRIATLPVAKTPAVFPYPSYVQRFQRTRNQTNRRLIEPQKLYVAVAAASDSVSGGGFVTKLLPSRKQIAAKPVFDIAATPAVFPYPSYVPRFDRTKNATHRRLLTQVPVYGEPAAPAPAVFVATIRQTVERRPSRPALYLTTPGVGESIGLPDYPSAFRVETFRWRFRVTHQTVRVATLPTAATPIVTQWPAEFRVGTFRRHDAPHRLLKPSRDYGVAPAAVYFWPGEFDVEITRRHDRPHRLLTPPLIRHVAQAPATFFYPAEFRVEKFTRTDRPRRLVVPINSTLTVEPVEVVTTTRPTGGWKFLSVYEDELARRRDLERKRRERELESESIQDEIDREIALLLREQEANEERQRELERLGELARKEVDLGEASQYSQRVAKAYQRAIEKQTFSSLEALDRELKRARDEEEFMLLTLLMVLD